MKVVALAGGVGGAKLVYGLAQCLEPDDLTIIVNTGDDFDYYGLRICPDLDTVCYTLAEIANPETGWGRKDETWHFMENLKALGGTNWFNIGDKDLATHIERTSRLSKGETLTQITQTFCKAWQIKPSVLPMSDDPIPTIVLTDQSELAFQEYFVALRCEPKVTGFRFEGIESAKPAPQVIERITNADLCIICPSNPWVSIDPILSIPDIQAAITGKTTVAVSPIISGQTIKGPAAKMFTELGITPSAKSVADHYGNLLNGFVLDRQDHSLSAQIPTNCLVTDTIMRNNADRKNLAQQILQFAVDQVI